MAYFKCINNIAWIIGNVYKWEKIENTILISDYKFPPSYFQETTEIKEISDLKKDRESREIKARYKQKQEWFGKEYKEPLINKDNDRETHCWKCKKNINNKFFMECAYCKWIICNCWACLC